MQAVPSRLKLKVTDEVRAAIRERLTKAATHYGQSGFHSDSGLFSPGNYAIHYHNNWAAGDVSYD